MWRHLSQSPQDGNVARVTGLWRVRKGPLTFRQYAENMPAPLEAKAVLFDLDGVLTPTAEVHERAWKRVFTELFAAEYPDVAPYTDADYFAQLDGKQRYDGVASLLHSRDIELTWGDPSDAPSHETVCAIGNLKNDAFLAELREHGIAAYPGSLALVEQLRAAGMTMGVVSSSKNAEEVLAAAGIRDFFVDVVDGVVSAREGLASKPAPDMFAAGARHLGVDPADAIAVEDAVSGVASAAAAGFGRVIGVDRGAGTANLTAAGADEVVADLAEFIV